MDVLGRPADYDTSHDTLVRVLVSQLRKKLEEYFATVGADEALIIEIPKGSYVPVFKLRERPPILDAMTGNGPRLGTGRRRLGIAVAVVVVIAAVVAIAGAAGFNVSFGFHRSAHPSVEAFWKQLFANTQNTYVVVSDVTLIEFEQMIRGPVSISEYEAHEFERLSEERISDPTQRMLARNFVNRVTTAMSDTQVVRDFGILASEARLPLNIISARDMSSSLVSSMNVVLLGSLRANPWVGLFEEQLNFRTAYQESPPAVRFVNKSPLAGEQADYAAEWRHTGYCRVAFLPNPRHSGNVLLISGSDVISTEAGGRFVASEDSMLKLGQALGLKDGQPWPNFEILLRTEIVNSTVPRFELVAYRPHRP